MLEPHWKRIAAIHLLDDGTVAAVWVAHDKETDTLHLVDACVFRNEVIAVIAEGLIARGRWIPIAWPKDAKEMADKLLERGCQMLYDHADTSEAMAEVASVDIEERMRTSRFKVDRRLQNWHDEFRTFFRADAKVPKDGHPLMAATRHAVQMLDFAKRQGPKGRGPQNHPRISII